MKIAGLDPKTLPTEEVLVLPRGEERVVFLARGLKDMSEFQKLVPIPEPPVLLTKDGPIADTKDMAFVSAWAGYQKRRTAYIVVHSLKPSQIEWDTVNLDDPSTWLNWEKDLKESGFSDIEIGRILHLVLDANCLNEAKLEEARAVFLRGPATA